MPGSTFGKIFKLTTFGESHGPLIGGVIDGCPAGLPLDEAVIQKELDLRKPGAGSASTKRKESDAVRIVSGVFEGATTGTPIGLIIQNEDQRSRDYGNLAEVFRPGHADFSYFKKYRGIRDYRGGGRASARETAIRVAGGAVAKLLLEKACGARIMAGTVELGGIAVPQEKIDLAHALERPFFTASADLVPAWEDAVAKARARGDTLGGIVRVVATGVPPGLGEPVFDKLDAALAFAAMSVGAVKGVEIGSGFEAARKTGASNNDALLPGQNGRLCEFASNNAGGILGGISTGQDIILQAAIKPIASISQEQDTVSKTGKPEKMRIGGRHDLSAIPRAVPVLSAMVALALADALLLQARMAVLPGMGLSGCRKK